MQSDKAFKELAPRECKVTLEKEGSCIVIDVRTSDEYSHGHIRGAEHLLYDLATLRSRKGEELLLFTGLSVSRTLPLGKTQNVCDEVDYFLAATQGGRGMFLFTSNVTGVEVPAANIRTAYQYVKSWDPARSQPVERRHWRDVMASGTIQLYASDTHSRTG